MPAPRFILTNYAETATVKNGTGGSPTPPARTEVAPYVMERALTPDRRTVWQAGAANAAGDWEMDLDLGSAKAVRAVAVHGVDCPGGTITDIWVGYINDTVYPSANYVVVDNLERNGRDFGLVLSQVFTYRYWFLVVDATAAPVIGRVVLGALTDVGLGPNPGARMSPHQNRLEQENEDGSVTILELGHPGHEFEYSFAPVLPAHRDLVESLSAVRGTFTHFDPRGRCFEVWLRNRARVESSRDGVDVDSVSIQLARVP